MRTRSFVAVIVLTSLLAAACGRDGDKSSETTAPAGTTVAPGATGLDAGAFGDLGEVCSEGDAKPVTGEIGIDGTTIRVATFSDKGFAGLPGISRELHEIAEAVTRWCNEHGGVRGYKIEPHLRDSAIANYAPLVVTSCEEDWFMVGGGAALDSAGAEEQMNCALPSIPAYAVSTEASEADLTVNPVPARTFTIGIGDLEWLKAEYPDSVDNVAILAASFPATTQVAARLKEAAEGIGYEFVQEQEFNVQGEANWAPFVQAMKNDGVEGLIYSGTPEFLAPIVKEMEIQRYSPAWIRADQNLYDQTFTDLGGGALDVVPVYAIDQLFPFERSSENPATQQYLDLLERYGPANSRIAFLGVQGLSSWMLFFKSLGECVDAGTVTRDCVYGKAAAEQDWTGGGLTVATDPGGGKASDCFALAQATPDGYTFPDVTGFGTSDLSDFFTCNPEWVVDLTGDYGEGAKCPSGVKDPLPSECAA